MPTETFLKLKLEKKARIIEAAITELSIHPYAHVNLANIIRDSGIARGSFYQYFVDKDDLYMYFINYVSQVKKELFKDIYDFKVNMTFLERFKKLYLRGFIFAEKYPKLIQAGYHMMQSSLFRSSNLYKNSFENGVQFFEMLIIQDQEKGIIKQSIDAKFLAESILSYMNTISFESYIYPSSNIKQIEKNIDKVIDILQKGIENHV